MRSAQKIAISLPTELMEKVERVRKQAKKSRSAFIRLALERALKELERKKLIERYQEGYREHPESEEEIEAAASAAAELFQEEPWK